MRPQVRNHAAPAPPWGVAGSWLAPLAALMCLTLTELAHARSPVAAPTPTPHLWLPLSRSVGSPKAKLSDRGGWGVRADNQFQNGNPGPLQSLHARLTFVRNGVPGIGQLWEAVGPDGRVRYASEWASVDHSGGDGWNGARRWRVADDGVSHTSAPDEDQPAETGDLFGTFLSGVATADRSSATGKTVSEGRNTFDVLPTSAAGGAQAEVWLQPRTRRIDRAVTHHNGWTETLHFDDYRPVGSTDLPYSVHDVVADETTPDRPAIDTTLIITSIDANPAIPDARFAPPPPDWSLPDGMDSVTVPFTFRGREILFPIRVDGHPLTAILDSGAIDLISPVVAAAVAAGAPAEPTRAQFRLGGNGNDVVDADLRAFDRLDIGGLTLHEPVFTVAEARAIEKNPLIGFQLLSRVVVHIDYDRRTLTFVRPDRFVGSGLGVSVPLQFHNHIPAVEGAIDGLPGLLTIDSGSGRSVDVTAPFTAQNHLRERYHPRITGITGYGFGGPTHAGVTRVATLTLGVGVVVHHPLTDLSEDTGGLLAQDTIAANIGEGVLSQFNVTFDYPHHRILFEPNRNYGQPDVFDRSGLTIDPNNDAARIVEVLPGGPAAKAGLQAGDVILAVNGHALPPQPQDQIWLQMRQAPGTHVCLTVRSAAGVRSVTLVLRDLV